MFNDFYPSPMHDLTPNVKIVLKEKVKMWGEVWGKDWKIILCQVEIDKENFNGRGELMWNFLIFFFSKKRTCHVSYLTHA